MALYRVTRGNRIRLEFEDDLELDRDAWHVVRVEHADGRIRVSLGGIGVMRARDRASTRARAAPASGPPAPRPPGSTTSHVEAAPERER